MVVTTQEDFAPHTWPTPVMAIQEVRQPYCKAQTCMRLYTVSICFTALLMRQPHAIGLAPLLRPCITACR